MNTRACCLAALLLMPLAGCGDEPTPPGEPPAAPGASTPGSPAPTGDPAACAEGTCDLRVTGPVQIPLQPRFDITELRVKSVHDDSVSLVATFAPGTSAQAISTGGSCSTEMESGSDDESSHLKAKCDTGTRLRLPNISIDLVSDPSGGILLQLRPR
ncbi:MAG TPA: hypothetical protein VFE65_04955 [Pseudonocardia sp.]|nr:hypothetical protein [Pseudonocardia sp.]